MSKFYSFFTDDEEEKPCLNVSHRQCDSLSFTDINDINTYIYLHIFYFVLCSGPHHCGNLPKCCSEAVIKHEDPSLL